MNEPITILFPAIPVITIITLIAGYIIYKLK
jgi:hypothetical protein